MNNAMEHIKVRYIPNSEGQTVPPLKVTSGGDWVDLYCAETTVLHAGDFKLIPLGVAMKLPSGYEAHIVPRSSTFKHWGIIQTNHMGVVDNSYCGNDDQWMMAIYATRDVVIEKDSRICQFRIEKNQPYLFFDAVEELSGENRGGFGSSGIK